MSQDSWVLVIEDDEGIRNSLAELLETEGFKVKLAQNGREALDLLIDGEKPHMILLDLMMPVMDGTTFLIEANKAIADFGSISICVLTASRGTTLPTIKNQLKLLKKPINIDELLNVVHQFTA